MEALYIAAWIIIPVIVGTLATAKIAANRDVKAVEKVRDAERKFYQDVDQAIAIGNHK